MSGKQLQNRPANKGSVYIKHMIDFASKKGVWLAVGSIIFLFLVFVKPRDNVIMQIPSPEFENVRLFYIWMLRLGVLALAVLAGVLWWPKKAPRLLFPAAVVTLGLFYMMVLTPFSAPDEARHFVSAYQLSSRLMGKQAVADETFSAWDTEEERAACIGKVLVREGDAVAWPYNKVNRDTYEQMIEQAFSMDTSNGYAVRNEAPVKTTPVVYFPQALGIVMARVLHLGYVPLIYMGRMFNLLAFAALAYIAVRVMPFKKETIMAVALLPMTLHLAASLSYDAVLIGLSMVFFAWCFHLAYEKKQVGTRDIVVLALLLVLMEPCKIVYLPLTGICLLISMKKFGTKKRYWISVCSVTSVMILSVFLINNVVLASWVSDSENVISWEGSAGYTLAELLSQPYRTCMIYYETLVSKFDYYLATMLGGYLGFLDPNLAVPYFCLYLLWGVMILSAVRREGEEAPMKSGQKAWVLFLVILSVLLVLFSMLLGWTPKNYAQIEGVQGRYFLPILPLALVLLFDNQLTVKKDFRRGIFYLECFVSVYSLIRILSLNCF